MRNVLFRKGLVLGIICLLMLTIPAIPALNVFKQDLNEKLISGQNYGKPDLKIKAVVHDYVAYDAYGRFDIYVENVGSGEVPSGPRTEVVSVYFDYLLNPLLFYHYRITNYHSYMEPHLPG